MNAIPRGARHHMNQRPFRYRDTRSPAAYADAQAEATALHKRGMALNLIRIETRLHPVTLRKMLGLPIEHRNGDPSKYCAAHAINHGACEARWRERIEDHGQVRFHDAVTADCGKPPMIETLVLRAGE